MKKYILAMMLSLSLTSFADNVTQEIVTKEKFDADWSVLNQRKIPDWFNQAKVGIFVVWGPYSVPSYSALGGYAEWYWNKLSRKEPNVYKFHKENYGDKKMTDLIDGLTAEFFDAEKWCQLFKNSGAKYVVTTANYHDGFAMYPTKYGVTNGVDNWNSGDLGPKQDIIGQLNDAGSKLGLKMGIYYSLLEWYHPFGGNANKFALEHFHPKFKEVVQKYKPWAIFLDGDWARLGSQWRSNELAKWLYTESAVKDTVVVNDRWGSSRGINGDVFSSEYGGGLWTTPEHPWQEDRGIGRSYGYNRLESISDYNSEDTIIELLSTVVGAGGNFLLCVGPTADGRIPVIMQERLLQLGDWLKINGDAIYGTKANPFWPRTFDWGSITSKDDKLYLLVYDSNASELNINGFDGKIEKATLIGKYGKVNVDFNLSKHNLSLNWDKRDNLPTVSVIELQLAGKSRFDKRQHQNSDGSFFVTSRAFKYSSDNIKPTYAGHGNKLSLTGWDNKDDYVTTKVVLNKKGKYNLFIGYSTAIPADANTDVQIEFCGKTFDLKTVDTKTAVINKLLGSIYVEDLGEATIKIKSKKGGKWNSFGFQSVSLKPTK